MFFGSLTGPPSVFGLQVVVPAAAVIVDRDSYGLITIFTCPDPLINNRTR